MCHRPLLPPPLISRPFFFPCRNRSEDEGENEDEKVLKLMLSFREVDEKVKMKKC